MFCCNNNRKRCINFSQEYICRCHCRCYLIPINRNHCCCRYCNNESSFGNVPFENTQSGCVDGFIPREVK